MGMQALAGLAISTLVLVSIAVGTRLLLLYRRSGESPELLLGAMLLVSVGLGYPLKIVAPYVDVETARPLLLLSSLAVAVGFSCLFAFTWRVFRRDSGWAGALAITGSLGLVVTGLWDGLAALRDAVPNQSGAMTATGVVHALTVAAAYLWTVGESFHYRWLVRRRAKLGLADPVVANRLLLWALMGLAVTAGILLNVGAGIRGISFVESPVVLLGSSTTGMTQAVLLVLAFSPPRAYVAWLRGRAEAQPA